MRILLVALLGLAACGKDKDENVINTPAPVVTVSNTSGGTSYTSALYGKQFVFAGMYSKDIAITCPAGVDGVTLTPVALTNHLTEAALGIFGESALTGVLACAWQASTTGDYAVALFGGTLDCPSTPTTNKYPAYCSN